MKDDDRVTTTGTPVDQSSSWLDREGTEAALTYLEDNWPHQQLTGSQREAWADILCQLHPGELKPALRKFAGRFRPDPYAVLEAVTAARPSSRVPNYVPPESETPTPPTAASEWFAFYRELLANAKTRNVLRAGTKEAA